MDHGSSKQRVGVVILIRIACTSAIVLPCSDHPRPHGRSTTPQSGSSSFNKARTQRAVLPGSVFAKLVRRSVVHSSSASAATACSECAGVRGCGACRKGGRKSAQAAAPCAGPNCKPHTSNGNDSAKVRTNLFWLVGDHVSESNSQSEPVLQSTLPAACSRLQRRRHSAPPGCTERRRRTAAQSPLADHSCSVSSS